MQPIDQVVGPLAFSEIEVDDGYIRGALGNQVLSVRRSRCWSGYVRSQYTKQSLHGLADVPGILDQEDSHALQFQPSGSNRVLSVRCGHWDIPTLWHSVRSLLSMLSFRIVLSNLRPLGKVTFG